MLLIPLPYVKGGASLAVFGMLDEVAYLLNLRAKDVECNPVGIAYATVARDGGEAKATLYCDEAKLTAEVREHLRESGVAAAPYGRVQADIGAAAGSGGGKIWIDADRASSTGELLSSRGIASAPPSAPPPPPPSAPPHLIVAHPCSPRPPATRAAVRGLR